MLRIIIFLISRHIIMCLPEGIPIWLMDNGQPGLICLNVTETMTCTIHEKLSLTNPGLIYATTSTGRDIQIKMNVLNTNLFVTVAMENILKVDLIHNILSTDSTRDKMEDIVETAITKTTKTTKTMTTINMVTFNS